MKLLIGCVRRGAFLYFNLLKIMYRDSSLDRADVGTDVASITAVFHEGRPEKVPVCNKMKWWGKSQHVPMSHPLPEYRFDEEDRWSEHYGYCLSSVMIGEDRRTGRQTSLLTHHGHLGYWCREFFGPMSDTCDRFLEDTVQWTRACLVGAGALDIIQDPDGKVVGIDEGYYTKMIRQLAMFFSNRLSVTAQIFPGPVLAPVLQEDNGDGWNNIAPVPGTSLFLETQKRILHVFRKDSHEDPRYAPSEDASNSRTLNEAIHDVYQRFGLRSNVIRPTCSDRR